MKKIISLIITAATLLACVLGLVSCSGGDSDLQYIKDKGELVIGITDYYPMDYLDEDGKTWIGFDADVANMVAKEWGVKAKFVIIDWEKKTTELATKSIDVVWNGMTATDELDEVIDFSVSYAENKQVAVIRKADASKFTSEATLKDGKIAVENGSAGDIVSTETLEAGSISRVDNQASALLEVKAGTSEIAIIDYTMAYGLVGKGDYSELEIVDEISFGREVFAVGVREGSDVADALNELFAKYYKDGTLNNLAEKYGSVALNDETLGALK